MKRSAVYLFAIFALLAAPLSAEPLPDATVVRIDVANTSNTCAWVSLYLRRNQTPWQMETVGKRTTQHQGRNATHVLRAVHQLV
jgi:hypothetical protein